MMPSQSIPELSAPSKFLPAISVRQPSPHSTSRNHPLTSPNQQFQQQPQHRCNGRFPRELVSMSLSDLSISIYTPRPDVATPRNSANANKPMNIHNYQSRPTSNAQARLKLAPLVAPSPRCAGLVSQISPVSVADDMAVSPFAHTDVVLSRSTPRLLPVLQETSVMVSEASSASEPVSSIVCSTAKTGQVQNEEREEEEEGEEGEAFARFASVPENNQHLQSTYERPAVIPSIPLLSINDRSSTFVTTTHSSSRNSGDEGTKHPRPSVLLSSFSCDSDISSLPTTSITTNNATIASTARLLRSASPTDAMVGLRRGTVAGAAHHPQQLRRMSVTPRHIWQQQIQHSHSDLHTNTVHTSGTTCTNSMDDYHHNISYNYAKTNGYTNSNTSYGISMSKTTTTSGRPRCFSSPTPILTPRLSVLSPRPTVLKHHHQHNHNLYTNDDHILYYDEQQQQHPSDLRHGPTDAWQAEVLLACLRAHTQSTHTDITDTCTDMDTDTDTDTAADVHLLHLRGADRNDGQEEKDHHPSDMNYANTIDAIKNIANTKSHNMYAKMNKTSNHHNSAGSFLGSNSASTAGDEDPATEDEESAIVIISHSNHVSRSGNGHSRLHQRMSLAAKWASANDAATNDNDNHSNSNTSSSYSNCSTNNSATIMHNLSFNVSTVSAMNMKIIAANVNGTHCFENQSHNANNTANESVTSSLDGTPLQLLLNLC